MNKRVLITGGGRGIGAATARYLAAQGYHLCLNYRQDRASAEAVVAEILATHPVECIAVQADVSVEAEVVRLFEEMDARLGPVTHLVNNAGRLQPQMRVLEMSAERINQTLTTNVTSCFLCCREAVRRMTAGGAIVNEGLIYRDIGSGFYATPRVNGQRVTLEISQQAENFEPGYGRGAVSSQRLATTVSGQLGEWIELGGSGRQAAGQQGGAFSVGTSDARDNRSIWLKVEEAE